MSGIVEEEKRKHDLLTVRKNNLISFRFYPDMLQLVATQNVGSESINDAAGRLLVSTLQRQLELFHHEVLELKEEMFL